VGGGLLRARSNCVVCGSRRLVVSACPPPQQAHLGLVGGADGAVLAPQRLDLVEIGRVLRAGQGGGRAGAELGGALHRERRDQRGVDVGGRAEVRRGPLPPAGGRGGGDGGVRGA